MWSTFLGSFGSTPGPMTLASSMFSDSEQDFSFPPFFSQVTGATLEPVVDEFQPQLFTSPSCFLDFPSLPFPTENLAERESPVYKAEPVAEGLTAEIAIAAKQDENDKPSEDGYNWRKYGHKQVKERERGYYRCGAPDCPVKKIVEWSVDGLVDSIIYRGTHNHLVPSQINKRGRDNERGYALETRGHAGFDQQEHHSKKRNQDVGVSYKPSWKPKIIVQTNSAVDLLDDGFRWRKYGQKVVKCNPHPRSYYRCTTPGCNVRKQVERAATDHKAVVTIYEGKHNHQAPSAKSIMS